MAAFPKMTLTNAGQALQTKVLAGATLTFTRIALGDGQLNGQPIAPLTALISQKATVEVDSVRVVNTTTAQAAGFFSNKDISTGFWWRETGLFAQDPDNGEILYGYTNAGDAGDYIPTVEDNRVEKYIFCSTAVANADTVNITIPSSDTYIPMSQKGAAGGVATLDSGGKVPEDQLPAIAASAVSFDNSDTEITADNVQAALVELKSDIANVAATAQYTQVTLTAAGWSSNSQTVNVPGVSASETAQEITPIPASASQEAYYQAEIQATAQGDGTLTFTCGDVPGSDLTVYVVVMEVEVAS